MSMVAFSVETTSSTNILFLHRHGSQTVTKSPLDYELAKLASLKKHPPPPSVTTEEFVIKYGLPNHGKNPHKLRIPQDLNEKDVSDVFGPAKGRNGRSGYAYAECKYEEILHRIAEIFPLVYLRDLPRSKVIAKQFARGIIMEKQKKKPVSWAEFAGTSNRNQRSKWLKKVTMCLAAIAKITNSNKNDVYKAEGIDDLLHDTAAEPGKTRCKVDSIVQDDTRSIRNGTEWSRCDTYSEKDIQNLIDLSKLAGLQLHAITEDYISTEKDRTELSTKALQEEGVLRRTEAKVLKLQKLHEGECVEFASDKVEAYNEMVRDAMVDYDAAVYNLKECNLKYEQLEARKMCLKKLFDALLVQIAHMKRGEIGMSLRPRPLCSQFDPTEISDSETIFHSPCALCLSGFPLKNIIVCTCGHLYHPWCAGIWFTIASKCADILCSKTVHPSWFSSFGFGKLHSPLQELEQSMNLEEEHEKLLASLTSTVLDSHPHIDTVTLYQEQLKESTMCRGTLHLDGSNIVTSTENTGTLLSRSGTGGSGNNSAAGRHGYHGQSVQLPVHSVQICSMNPSLPSIDEVDSPEKNEDRVIEPPPQLADKIEDVTELIGGGFSNMSCKVGIEAELQERIRQLKEEDAKFDRIEKLRQEAAELEGRKRLREKAEVNTCATEGGAVRAVVKVPPLPPLSPRPFSENAENKRKTRSEIAAEEAAKEVEEVKKKSRKTKRNQRITPLG